MFSTLNRAKCCSRCGLPGHNKNNTKHHPDYNGVYVCSKCSVAGHKKTNTHFHPVCDSDSDSEDDVPLGRQPQPRPVSFEDRLVNLVCLGLLDEDIRGLGYKHIVKNILCNIIGISPDMPACHNLVQLIRFFLNKPDVQEEQELIDTETELIDTLVNGLSRPDFIAEKVAVLKDKRTKDYFIKARAAEGMVVPLRNLASLNKVILASCEKIRLADEREIATAFPYASKTEDLHPYYQWHMDFVREHDLEANEFSLKYCLKLHSALSSL